MLFLGVQLPERRREGQSAGGKARAKDSRPGPVLHPPGPLPKFRRSFMFNLSLEEENVIFSRFNIFLGLNCEVVRYNRLGGLELLAEKKAFVANNLSQL